MGDEASVLAALLAPYADPTPGQAGRLRHVPPPIAAQALSVLLPDQRTTRLNLVQPPMTWLVSTCTGLAPEAARATSCDCANRCAGVMDCAVPILARAMTCTRHPVSVSGRRGGAAGSPLPGVR